MPTYNPSSATLPVTVSLLALPSVMTCAVYQNSVQVTTVPEETPANFTATLKTSAGVPIVGKYVIASLTAGGLTTPMTGTTNTLGMVSFTLTIPNATTASFAATFQGDAYYIGSSSSVSITVTETRIDTSLALTALTSVVEDTDTVVSATMKVWNAVTSAWVAAVGFQVTLAIGGTAMGTVATNTSGVASWTVKFNDPGTYTVTATFAGLTTTT